MYVCTLKNIYGLGDCLNTAVHGWKNYGTQCVTRIALEYAVSLCTLATIEEKGWDLHLRCTINTCRVTRITMKWERVNWLWANVRIAIRALFGACSCQLKVLAGNLYCTLYSSNSCGNWWMSSLWLATLDDKTTEDIIVTESVEYVIVLFW